MKRFDHEDAKLIGDFIQQARLARFKQTEIKRKKQNRKLAALRDAMAMRRRHEIIQSARSLELAKHANINKALEEYTAAVNELNMAEDELQRIRQIDENVTTTLKHAPEGIADVQALAKIAQQERDTADVALEKTIDQDDYRRASDDMRSAAELQQIARREIEEEKMGPENVESIEEEKHHGEQLRESGDDKPKEWDDRKKRYTIDVLKRAPDIKEAVQKHLSRTRSRIRMAKRLDARLKYLPRRREYHYDYVLLNDLIGEEKERVFVYGVVANTPSEPIITMSVAGHPKYISVFKLIDHSCHPGSAARQPYIPVSLFTIAREWIGLIKEGMIFRIHRGDTRTHDGATQLNCDEGIKGSWVIFDPDPESGEFPVSYDKDTYNWVESDSVRLAEIRKFASAFKRGI